jgi:hypothetical protein
LNITKFCCFFLLVASNLLFAAQPTTLTPGQGGIIYDAFQASGPTSTKTSKAGQWIDNLNTFNAPGTAYPITRFYVYGGDIEISCTDPSKCVPGVDIVVPYSTAAGGFGQESVAAYRAAFPNQLILATIDGQLSTLPLLKTSQVVASQVSTLITDQICADPNVDGVFFDLESFEASAFQPQSALFKLYHQTSTALRENSSCRDANHPNGKFMAIFMNPNKLGPVTAGQGPWEYVQGILGSNGYLVVGSYDVNDVCPPVASSPTGTYFHSIAGKLITFMVPNSEKYKIKYSVAIPAASSFSEFEKYCLFDSSKPDNCSLESSSGFQQVEYLKSARGVIYQNCKNPALFMGVDYWAWNQYVVPCVKTKILLPNIPTGAAVSYMQQTAFR